jgi:hypothetical protein
VVVVVVVVVVMCLLLSLLLRWNIELDGQDFFLAGHYECDLSSCMLCHEHCYNSVSF